MQQLQQTYDLNTSEGVFQHLKSKTTSIKHERFHEKKRKLIVEDRHQFSVVINPGDNLKAIISGVSKAVTTLTKLDKRHHEQIKRFISEHIHHFDVDYPVQHQFTMSLDEKDKSDGVFYIYRYTASSFDYSLILSEQGIDSGKMCFPKIIK